MVNTHDDDTQRVRSILAAAETNVANLDPLFSQKITPPAVRSHITRVIIWAFVLYLGATAIFIFFAPVNAIGRVGNLIEIIKIALLPVVTFVIGHYFGSKTE